MDFNLLALIEAGNVKEDDNLLPTMQNISREHAHSIARWLVLATGQPCHLRSIGFHGSEEIRYTPEQVAEGIRKGQERARGDFSEQ